MGVRDHGTNWLLPFIGIAAMLALILPVSCAFCADKTKPAEPGVMFEFFEGIVSDVVPQLTSAPNQMGVCPTFTNKLPVPTRKDNFSMRFSGTINIASDGDYTFWTISDDASFLWIDSVMVVTNGGYHGSVEKEGTIRLKSGPHSINVVMCQGGGPYELTVRWKGPGFEKQGIPTSVLSAYCDNPYMRRARSVSTVKSDQVKKVGYSRRRGFYDKPFELILSCDTPDATIAYTLDGSDPASSQTIKEGIRVKIDPDSTEGGRKKTGCVTVRAVAFKEGMRMGESSTHTYIFLNRVTEQSDALRPQGSHYTTAMDQRVDKAKVVEGLQDLPSVSIVTTDEKIFGGAGLTRTFNWPRVRFPCSMELIYPDNAKFEEFRGCQINAGIQMQGAVGAQPGNHKNSWQLIFNDQFGPGSLKHHFFEAAPFKAETATRSFDRLMFRGGFNDSWATGAWWGSRQATTYLRDAFSRILQLQQGHVAPHDLFVHLYLNGQYWGVYDVVEKADENFMASYFGGTDDDYWAGGNEKTTQAFSKWEKEFLPEQGGQKCRSRDFRELCKYLDLPHFINHKLINGISGMNDSRQWRHAHRVTPFEGPIHYFNWDYEFSWGAGANLDADSSRVILGQTLVPTVTDMFMNNGRFRTFFHDTVYRNCYNDGALSKENMLKTWDKLCASMEKGIWGESARWGDEMEGTGDKRGFTGVCTVDTWKNSCGQIRTNMLIRRDDMISALRGEGRPVDPATGGWVPQDGQVKFYPSIDPPLFMRDGIVIGSSATDAKPGSSVTIQHPVTNVTIYYTVNGTDPCNLDNGQPTGTSAKGGVKIDLRATTVLKARAMSDKGEWSALHEVAFHVPGADNSGLKITEIMYNPLPEYEGNPIGARSIDCDAQAYEDGALESVGQLILNGSAPDGIGNGDRVVISGAINSTNNGMYVVHKVTSNNLSMLSRSVVFLKKPLTADEPNTTAKVAFMHSGTKFEFLELKNTGTTPLDLTGMRIKGVDFDFAPGQMMQPGAFKVIAKDFWFKKRYDTVTPDGYFAPSDLKNKGETLAVLDRWTNIVTAVRFNDAPPWPLSADGNGRSLVPASVNPKGSQNDAKLWSVSQQTDGSPGVDDKGGVLVPRVVINEIMTHTDPPDRDAIELYNSSDREADISGWFLTDKKKNLKKWEIPKGTKIGAYRYAVFYEGHYKAKAPAELAFSRNEFGKEFSLSSLGDEVYVASPDGTYIHGFDFDALWNGKTIGRHLNSFGDEDFVPMEKPSLGSENRNAVVGPLVIREIMYHPYRNDIPEQPDNGFEFVELKNISRAPLSLRSAAGDAWKVSGAKFTFSNETVVPSGGLVLLIEDEIDVPGFRAKYKVPDDVQVFQFRGKLDNGGESIKIMAPDEPLQTGSKAGEVGYVMIDKVKYSDSAPWPADADGSGRSLVRKSDTAFGNDPSNWKLSRNRGGTPGW